MKYLVYYVKYPDQWYEWDEYSSLEEAWEVCKGRNQDLEESWEVCKGKNQGDNKYHWVVVVRN